MPRIHPRVYSRILRPSFAIGREHQSLHTCVCCRRRIERECDKRRCNCNACVYCSEECKANDSIHQGSCSTIREITEGVTETASRLEQWLARTGETLAEDYPENLYQFGVPEQERGLCQNFPKSYFGSRQALITALVREGLLRTGSDGALQMNELALDIAIMHCQHLFMLDKYDSFHSRADGLGPKKDLLLNLLLFTGRYQELYDMCCFFARAGEKYFSHYSDYYSDELISSPIHAWKEDITTSYFRNYALNCESLPVAALNHMFIVKQLMHQRMEVLGAIDNEFLHNQDCVALIGEYLGINREWLRFEKDWYKKQALEILSPFARCNTTEAEFGKLYGCSESFLACPDFRLIKDVIRTGARYIESEPCVVQTRRPGVRGDPYAEPNTVTESDASVTIKVRGFGNDDISFKIKISSRLIKIFRAYANRFGYRQESLRFIHNGKLVINTDTPQTRGLEDGDAINCFWQPIWRDTVVFCRDDHEFIVSEYIRPRFGAAVDALNAIAGYDALSRNIDHYKLVGADPQLPAFSFTQFVTDAMKICHKSLVEFDSFIDFMDCCDEGEMQMHYDRPYDFSYGLMAALVLERKIAQAMYYMSLQNGNADPILALLPNEDGARLRRKHAPPFEQNDPFLTFPLRYFTHTLTPDISDRILLVSKWMPDVMGVIQSLFDDGLATVEHLSDIFGHSSLVSNAMWELEQAEGKRKQRSITPMMQNKMPWKEGSVVWDTASGLKIQYLTLEERRTRFEDPAVKNHLTRKVSDAGRLSELYATVSRCFGELDLTACQRNKDPNIPDDTEDTIQELQKTFDGVGIPRLLILNGSEKNMWKSGWKWVGDNPSLGDEAVQIGSRVALALDDAKCSHCTLRNFWREQGTGK
ncbi:hypothetical protein ACHAXT_008734 [Thalassiosira profunda]